MYKNLRTFTIAMLTLALAAGATSWASEVNEVELAIAPDMPSQCPRPAKLCIRVATRNGIHVQSDADSASMRLKAHEIDYIQRQSEPYFYYGLSSANQALRSSVEMVLRKRQLKDRDLTRYAGLGVLALGLLGILWGFSRKRYLWTSLGLLFLGWMIANSDLYFDPTLYLPRDNWLLNFPMFAYVSNWVKHLHTFPDWVFTSTGGTWMEVMSINYLSLLPSRWIGTLFAMVTDLPMNTLWKTSSLVFGQALFSLGMFLLARRLFRNSLASWLAVALSFVSPLNFATLHQEQVLALVITLPFQWYLFLLGSTSRVARVAFFSLLGFSLNLGYPQHFFLYYVVVLLCALLFKETRSYLKSWIFAFRADRTAIVLSMVLFFVGISPLAYAYLNYYKQIASPLRKQADSIKVENYEAYRSMDGIGTTSVFPAELLSLVVGESNPLRVPRMMDDRFLVHTPALAILIFIAILFSIRAKGFQLSLLLMLILLSIGVHGPLPRLLWGVLPGMEVFRQWYHFSDLLNLHLVFLSMSSLLCFSNRKYLFSTLVFFSIAGGLWVGNRTLEQYRYWTHSLEPQYDYESADGFASALFRGETTFQINAVPIPMSAFTKTPLAPFLWANETGGLGPAPVKVKALSQGFLLEWGQVPMEAQSLIVTQFNDGNWQSSNQLLKRGPFIETLTGSSTYLTLSRKKSIWPLLNLFSALMPLLLGLSLVFQNYAHRFSKPIEAAS